MKYLFLLMFLSFNSFSAEIGRFQLVTHPVSSNRTLLLDTVTGKIWENTCFRPNKENNLICDVSAWTPQDIIGINSSYEKVQSYLKKLNDIDASGKN